MFYHTIWQNQMCLQKWSISGFMKITSVLLHWLVLQWSSKMSFKLFIFDLWRSGLQKFWWFNENHCWFHDFDFRLKVFEYRRNDLKISIFCGMNVQFCSLNGHLSFILCKVQWSLQIVKFQSNILQKNLVNQCWQRPCEQDWKCEPNLI